MNTRRIVFIATIAALYAIFTIVIAPVSYGPVQFRISEVLKVFVLFDPFTVIGIGIGTFFANLASPYAGPWELIFMPITDMIGGGIAWGIYRLFSNRWPAIPMVVYALTTGAAVGLMLTVLGVGGFWLLFVSVGASELIILVAGTPIIFYVAQILQKRGSRLFSK